MPKIIISDTSTLVIFQKIDELGLLKKNYKELVTTEEIASEYGEPLPEWIKICEVQDKKYQRFLETQIDKGEASAIALSTEFEEVLLLLDDLKARKLAQKLNIKITGALGIIHQSKNRGYIEKVKPVIDKLLATDFRISQNIIDEILKMNNEFD